MMKLLKVTINVLLLVFLSHCSKETTDPFDDFILAESPLFVSPYGDDNVTYENNDINNPWKTPQHAWMNAQPGDVVYFREGTYPVTETINTKYHAANGTAEAPITFTSYPGENAVIEGNVGGGPIFIIEKSYNSIDRLTLRGSNFGGGGLEGSVIFVGWDLEADHFKITNSTIEITQSNTYSNNASIRINSTLSNFAEISNCRIIGDGGTIGIQIFRTQGVKISNNEFYNCGLGVYLKHSNALNDDPSLTNSVINNYFHGLSREAVYGVFNYANISNNLLVDCGISFGDDGGVGDGYVGADYNTISHNTLYNASIEFKYEGREEDPNKGCLHNKIIDNLIMNRSIYHNYNDIDADIQSDFNLYPDIGNIIAENGIEYTLSQWQSQNNSDANSFTGTPLFLTSNPSEIEDYRLDPGSPGKNKASDGSDMGADVSLIGIKDI